MLSRGLECKILIPPKMWFKRWRTSSKSSIPFLWSDKNCIDDKKRKRNKKKRNVSRVGEKYEKSKVAADIVNKGIKKMVSR